VQSSRTSWGEDCRIQWNRAEIIQKEIKSAIRVLGSLYWSEQENGPQSADCMVSCTREQEDWACNISRVIITTVSGPPRWSVDGTASLEVERSRVEPVATNNREKC
jgi:hypothetical protein